MKRTSIQNLTYIDRQIIAHDFLNPDIPDNYHRAPVIMMADDQHDAQIMRNLEETKLLTGSLIHSVRANIGLDVQS